MTIVPSTKKLPLLVPWPPDYRASIWVIPEKHSSCARPPRLASVLQPSLPRRSGHHGKRSNRFPPNCSTTYVVGEEDERLITIGLIVPRARGTSLFPEVNYIKDTFWSIQHGGRCRTSFKTRRKKWCTCASGPLSDTGSAYYLSGTNNDCQIPDYGECY